VYHQFELLRNNLRNLDVVISTLTTNHADRLSDIDDDIVSNLVQNNSRISTEEITERLNSDRSIVFKKDWIFFET